MIRLGVVGYGGRGAGMVGVFREIEPDVRVVGIVDPDEAAVRDRLKDCDKEDVVFYKTLDRLVAGAKPDALLIATRCNMHAPYAIQAAKYDLPLFLEKPVATSMKQATGLERAFEKSGAPVVVSFPLRTSPLCVLAKDFLDKGAVGSSEHIAAVNYVPYGTCYWDMWYRDYKTTQGLFIQKATHDFDYMTYLMGSPIVQVATMATAGRVFGGRRRKGLRCSQCKETETCLESPQNRARHNPAGRSDHVCLFSVDCGTPQTGMNEDSSSAVVQFASGVHGVYTQVFYTRRDAGTRGAVISGYHGTLSFDWYTNELRRVRHHQPFTDVVRADSGMSHFGGDMELMHDFADIVRGKGKSRSTIWHGVQSIYTCLAAKESARKGRFVKVRQVGGG